MVAGSLFIVILYNRNSWPVSTTDRKYFHLLVIGIFQPGIHLAPELTRLASVGAFIIFVVLEVGSYF